MATPAVASGDVSGLLAFLDFLISKGYGSAGSVNPLKSATRNVFSAVEGEDYSGFDVRNFDIEEYLDRFQTKSIGTYTADSLSAYRNRFRRAIEWYRSYLADPNWKPPKSGRAPAASNGASKPEKKQRTTRASGAAGAATPPPSAPAPPAPQPGGELIAYPFPLKSGRIAQLHLPTQLDREDAERLTQFVRALVFEQPRQLPSGE